MTGYLFCPEVVYPGHVCPRASDEQRRGNEALLMAMSAGVNLPKHPLESGRFGTVLEPARKIRVFAMVDQVRQRCLLPRSEWAMTVLGTIPQDGTFNQIRPLLALDKSAPFML